MKIHEVKIKITTEKIVKIGIRADGMIAAQTEAAAMISARSFISLGFVPISTNTVFEILGTDFVI